MFISYSEEDLLKELKGIIDNIKEAVKDVVEGEVFDGIFFLEGEFEMERNDWKFIESYGETKFFFMLLDEADIYASKGDDNTLFIRARLGGE